MSRQHRPSGSPQACFLLLQITLVLLVASICKAVWADVPVRQQREGVETRNGTVPSKLPSKKNYFPSEITIGCLVPLDTADGVSFFSAIQLAVHHVSNDSSLLPGVRIKLVAANCTYTPFPGQMAGLHLMLEERPIAIIGPTTSSQVALLSGLAGTTRIPLLSYSATDPLLTTSRQWPYFMRTVPSDATKMEAIADLLALYRYRHFVAIFTDDRFGRNGISVLENILQNRWGLISMASFVPPSPALTVFRAEWKEHMSGQEGPSSPKADVYSLAAYDALLLVARAVHNVLSGDTTDGADSQNSLVEPVPPSQGPGAYNEDGAGSGSFPGVESGGVARAAGAAGAEGNSSSSDGSSRAAAAGSVFVSNSSAAGQEPGTWAHVPMPVVAPGDSASSLIPILSGAARSNFGPLLRDALLQASVMGATGRVRLTPEGDVKDGSVQLLNVWGSEFVTVGYWRMGKGFTTSDDPLAPAVQANSSTTLNLLFPGNLEKAPSGWLARQQDPLRIAVPNKKGYNQFVEILPPTAAQGNDRFTGFCLDLFRAAVARLPYELSYEFLQFGEGDATPSYTEMVYAVANHTYDGAIGDIAVLNFRSEAVDFTVPIQQSGLSLVSYVAPNDNPWISYHPFSWQMWLLLACLIVFSGLVLCFLESSHPAHLLRREYDRPHQEVMSYIWMSFAPVGFAKVRGIVKTSLGRILTVTWFALMIVVSSSYIAALTAALVLQKLQLPISSIYDAAGSDVMVGYQYGSFVYGYLVQLGFSPSRLVPLNSEQDYYEALTSQRVALIVDEDPYLNVFASQYCQMLRASQAFNVLNSAFAFQKGSLFGADISQALLELAQNGELQRIRSMYIKSTASSVDCIFSRLHLQSTASSVDCIFSRLHFQSTAFSVDCIFSRLHLQSTASSVDCIFSRLHLQSTASSVDCIFSRLRVLELPGASAS
ncbi:unnamed protein product [Closterium sp. NIES-54]